MDMRKALEADSKYLKAILLPEDTPVVLTMSGVKTELVGQGNDAENKAVLYFQGKDKGLILNKTNGNTIMDLYGEDSDEWIGQKIAIFRTTTDYAGKTVECIRVKPSKPKGAAAPAKEAAESFGDDEEVPF